MTPPSKRETRAKSPSGVAPRIREPNRKLAAQAIGTFLHALGVDTRHPELIDTAKRVADTFVDDLLSGYKDDPKAILSGASRISRPTLTKKACPTHDIVMLTGIPVMTMCPHHLLPALGTGHVGYIPNHKWVGLGDLAKLVDCFSRRLALQEAIGAQVVEALVQYLDTPAAGCVINLSPACVICRGARRATVKSVTSHFAGPSSDHAEFRQVFLTAVKTSQ